jgi:hypothetical protein
MESIIRKRVGNRVSSLAYFAFMVIFQFTGIQLTAPGYEYFNSIPF